MAAACSSYTGEVTERRGIPAASFVQDVQSYLNQSGLDVNSALAFLQERLQQYRVVEMKLLAQQRDLQAKIPDIEKCLDIVVTLQAKKDSSEALVADFEVSEGIYSRARIEDAESVCLWLGANVMLQYSCEEATALLQTNLENAKASLEVLVADLQFLRDQVTITQSQLLVYTTGMYINVDFDKLLPPKNHEKHQSFIERGGGRHCFTEYGSDLFGSSL